MNIIAATLESKYAKTLSLSFLFLPFVLDALHEDIYFYIAAFVAFLFLLLAFLEVKKEQKLYKTEILTVPIVIAIEPDVSAKYALSKLFRELEEQGSLKNLKHNLKKYHNIVEDDLLFEFKSDLYNKDAVVSFMQIIHHQITKIKQNIPNQVEFHIIYYSRPAYGFFLGYIFAKEDVVIYQQNPDKDLFERVADIKDREYKNEVKAFEKFTIHESIEVPDSKEILLAIKASSHYITLGAEGLKQYKNVLSMVANHNGTIRKDEDWVLYGREIFTALMQLQNRFDRIVIAHNMPESIAIIVGMAASNFWPVMITQFERGEYKELMQLNELRYYI